MPTGVPSHSQARLLLLVSIAVTALLYVVPYGHVVAYPLMLLSTLAHELGHGVVGWLVGGSFHSLRIFPDGSGVAQVGGQGGRIARALVAAGGLCGPAVAAAFGFGLARRPRQARLALAGLAVFLLAVTLLLVRNAFGVLFVGVLAVALGMIGWRAGAWASQMTLLFLSVQLALSVFSRSDYLFTPHAQAGGGTMPSDVANMAAALLLPYWVWGALCGAFSVAVLVVGGWVFLRGLSGPVRR